MSLKKTPDIVRCIGNRTWAITFGSELLVMDPGFDCGTMSATAALKQPDTTLARLWRLVSGLELPLSHVFLSHDHPDHSPNVPAFLELHDRPLFDFRLVCHERAVIGARVEAAGFPTLRVSRDHVIELDEGPVEVLYTPGHRHRRDSISVWLPEAAILFVGDLVQPQGPSYQCCDFWTAFSNHVDGDLVSESLRRYRGLPFETLLMGHDGVLFDRNEGLRAIDTTLAVLSRTKELAEELAAGNIPSLRHGGSYLSIMERVEYIYDTISRERGLSEAAIEGRKCTGHHGSCPRCDPASFYCCYDIASIEYYVSQTIG